MLVKHDLPDELRNNEKLRKELRQVAFDQAGDSSPLSADESKTAYALIESGEVFQDIFYSVNIVFGLVTKPDSFSNLDKSFKSYLDAVIHLPESIIFDLDPKLAFDKISDQIDQVKAGNPPDDPEILNNTLKTIYSTPDVGNTICIACSRQ
ncbi:MAG: hypothetical protein GQ475_01095 [Methylococcaceae bacterium]|nr:hypothetical protein [Methylococcaceae bacterium]